MAVRLGQDRLVINSPPLLNLNNLLVSETGIDHISNQRKTTKNQYQAMLQVNNFQWTKWVKRKNFSQNYYVGKVASVLELLFQVFLQLPDILKFSHVLTTSIINFQFSLFFKNHRHIQTTSSRTIHQIHSEKEQTQMVMMARDSNLGLQVRRRK